jgi:hypothetical protein
VTRVFGAATAVAAAAAGVAVYPLFTRDPPRPGSPDAAPHRSSPVWLSSVGEALAASRVGVAGTIVARLLRDAVTVALMTREYSKGACVRVCCVSRGVVTGKRRDNGMTVCGSPLRRD